LYAAGLYAFSPSAKINQDQLYPLISFYAANDNICRADIPVDNLILMKNFQCSVHLGQQLPLLLRALQSP
jgi:hypothetical protein